METFPVVTAGIGILLGLIIVLFLIEKSCNNHRRKTLMPLALQFGFTELSSKDFNIKTHYPSPFVLPQQP